MMVNAEISEALRQLGYTVGFEMGGPEPDIVSISIDRYRVEFAGRYIGIWDRHRHTFVD